MTYLSSTGFKNKICGLAANVVANGDFATDALSWSPTNATLASVAGGASGNCLQIAGAGTNPGQASQTMTTIPGQAYSLRLRFKKGTGSGGQAVVLDGGGNILASSRSLTDNAWTTHEVLFRAPGTAATIALESLDPGAGTTALFDLVTCAAAPFGAAEALAGFSCALYTGAQPATGDAAASGTLLASWSGLRWTTPGDGSIALDLSTGAPLATAVGTGVAGYFCVSEAGDSIAIASTQTARIWGAIASSGAEMNMTNTSVVVGEPILLPALSWALQA
jgi:hypothetical protein